MLVSKKSFVVVLQLFVKAHSRGAIDSDGNLFNTRELEAYKMETFTDLQEQHIVPLLHERVKTFTETISLEQQSAYAICLIV